MKPKAVFLTEQKYQIPRVYDEKTRARLLELFDLHGDVLSGTDAAEAADAECIFSTWGFPELSESEVRELFPRLKVVFYGAGSVQYFARPLLRCGVRISSAWRANSVPVIEYAAAQIVLAAKGFFLTSRLSRSREGRGRAAELFQKYPGAYRTRVGLIGLGAIGSGVAERLQRDDFEVLAYDPYASEEKAARLGVRLAPLEEMFRTCEVISNHTPNIPATRGMLTGRLFDMMGETATFINTGRGAQVVEDDLIAALKEVPTRSAVLDVTDPEPPEDGSPLYTMENVFLTPHIAGSSGGECARMGEYMLREAERFLAGRPLEHEVTLDMLETMA